MRCPGRTVKKMFVLTNVNAGRNYIISHYGVSSRGGRMPIPSAPASAWAAAYPRHQYTAR